MKYFVVLVGLILGAAAIKERVEDGSIDDITSKLLIEIEKRLNEFDDYEDSVEDGLAGVERQECQYTLTNSTIIRTKDSLEDGATFLSNIVDAQSQEECEQECCDLNNCTLAVFKEKGSEHSCYLFDCGTPSVCQFTQHPGFLIMEFKDRHTANKVQEKHENDLEDLVQPSTTTTAPTTTTTPTTTPTTTSPIAIDQGDNFQPVPLYGVCTNYKECGPSHTDCLAGYCVCLEGYHAQDGICSVKNGKTNTDGSSPIQNPVPAKDKENKQESSEETDKTKTQEQDLTPDQSSNQSPPESHEDTPTIEQPVVNVDTPKVKPQVNEQSQETSGTESQQSSNKSEIQDGDSLKSDEETNADEQKTKTKNMDSENENEKGDTKQQGSVSEVFEEKIDTDTKPFARMSNKGAVIALALGLSITALLFLFVLCRLRNMKRRLRKGRPMNSNEADYLINGMYL